MPTRYLDGFPTRHSPDQFTHQRRLARIRRQAANGNDDGILVHELTDDKRTRTSSSNPRASASSNRAGDGLSRSSTPINRASFIKGTTISEFDALSQAVGPGNSCTFGTITVSHFAAPAPHTPWPTLLRTHAGLPWNGPRTSSPSFSK